MNNNKPEIKAKQNQHGVSAPGPNPNMKGPGLIPMYQVPSMHPKLMAPRTMNYQAVPMKARGNEIGQNNQKGPNDINNETQQAMTRNVGQY